MLGVILQKNRVIYDNHIILIIINTPIFFILMENNRLISYNKTVKELGGVPVNNKKKQHNRLFDPAYSTGRIIVIYLILGVLWIIFTDMVAKSIAEDAHELSLIQSYKGWLYVVLTAGVFYWLIYLQMKRYKSALNLSHKSVAKLNEIQKDLLISEERYQLAVEGAKDGIWDWNLKNNEYFFSKNWLDAFGYDESDIPNDLNEMLNLIHVKDRDKAYKDFRDYVEKKKPEYESIFRIKKKQNGYRYVLARGAAVWNERGEAIRIAGSHTDITEQIKLQERLKEIAYVDELTEFSNRQGMEKQFNEALGSHKRMAFVIIDIDDFKDINEIFGHETGDELLKTFAKDLKHFSFDDVIIGRVGGDEFGLLIPLASGQHEFVESIDREFKKLKKDRVIESQKIYVSVSAGYAIYPDDGDSFSALFQSADLALHNAKTKGKDDLIRYRDEFYEKIKNHVEMSNAMRQGLKRGEFVLVYQPQISFSDDTLSGTEALLRWHHPDKGLIPPNAFIPLAEETGFIIDIDRFVIDRVCRQKRLWNQQGFKDMTVSVNISQVSFDRGHIVKMFSDSLKKHDIQGSEVVVEITETAAMKHREKAIKTLKELREMDIQVAIDDFGTGYASLRNLWDLPIDVLKIDQFFTEKIEKEEKTRLFVKILINSAHALGYKITAEGIETAEQQSMMIDWGSDYGQGYHLFRPSPPETIEEAYIKK